MRASSVFLFAAISTASWLLGAGCSLNLEWSDDNHPCNKSGECNEGYSCLVSTCIKVESLGVDEPCTFSEQCTEGLTCAIFACRKKCDGYLTTQGCDAGQYCKPLVEVGGSCDNSSCPGNQSCRKVTSGDLRCHYYQGVCVAGDDCDADTSDKEGCSTAGEYCVTLNAKVKACVTGCQIGNWNSGTYSDNCRSGLGSERYCTPIGAENTKRLVCLDSYAGQSAGSSCNPVFPQPCKPELGCIEGECAAFCRPGDNSTCNAHGSNLVCTRREDLEKGDDYGICVSDT